MTYSNHEIVLMIIHSISMYMEDAHGKRLQPQQLRILYRETEKMMPQLTDMVNRIQSERTE